MKGRVFVYTGAAMLWSMAVLGAIAIAQWRSVSARDTIWLVLVVAALAILGTFVPAVRLGLARLRESEQKDGDSRTGGSA